MARYRLDIGAKYPLTPTMLEYHGAIRLRFGAMKLLIQKAVYEAMRSKALLDRPIAHEFTDWANNLRPIQHGYLASKFADEFHFMVTRED